MPSSLSPARSRAAIAIAASTAVVGSLLIADAAAAADSTPPAPVSTISVSADTSRVKLDWSSNKESDLAGYRVFRSTAADGLYTELTASVRTSSDYSDTSARVGFPSYYRVVAVDKSGNVSAATSATGTRKDGTTPAAPKSGTVTGAVGSYVVDWADNTEADLAGYLVSRATTSGGSYTKLTSTPIAASTFADTSTAAGATPYYKISAVDFSGRVSSTLTVTLPDTKAPAAVRNMTVAADTSKVKLDWSSNSESDLAGYLVFRSGTAEGTYTQLTATPRTSSDYSDTAAPAGILSYYRVVAVDKSGNQSAPVAASGTRKDGVAPAAPKTLTAAPAATGVTLDWADNVEGDLAGYVVSRATSSGGTYTKLTATPIAASTFTDATAPAGATAYYRVTAVDASGNTSTAAAVSATRPDTVAPAAVRSMVVTSDTSRVKLDWASNSDSDLAGYLVYRSSTADGTFTKLTATAIATSDYSDTTAPAGVVSYYQVVAVDKSGNSSAPVSVSGTRKDGVAPAAPKSLTAAPSVDGIVLDWADNTEADLAGYVVSRATSSGGTYTKLTATPIAGSAFTDTTASAGATVYYRVAAVDASGNTSSTVSVSATRPDTVAPAAVRSLVVSADTSRVKLDWTSNSESDLAGYLVYRSATADGTFTRLTATAVTSSEYSDTTTVPGVTSYYRVVAVDKSGNESEAVAASGTRRDTAAPAAPTGLASSWAEGVVLDWADNTEADLAGYVVSRASTSGGTYTKLTATPVTASTFTDVTAPAGATLYYRVAAVDASGNTSSTAQLSVTVPDTAAPATPAGLTANATAKGIVLTWKANAESDVRGYRLSSSSTADGEFAPLNGDALITGTTFTDTPAASGTTVHYRLVAVDASGNVSEAASASAIALDTIAPAVPTGLVATGSDADVALDWADSTDSDLAGYLVFRSASEAGAFTQLTAQPIPDSSYTDSSAPAGAVSYYVVKAVDAAGNVSQGVSASATRTVGYSPVAGANATVAWDGSGDYRTVAEALAAAPAGTAPWTIAIKPGSYLEKLTVSRANLTIVGAGAAPGDVVLAYNDAAGTLKADGTALGTTGSASVLIKANDVTVKNLSIVNSYVETGSGSEQAVALKTTGDRLVFDTVRLIGDQDTLYADSPAVGTMARSYYVNSYIEGDVDFIFGRGTAVFDRSTLKAATRGSTTNNGYVTAASTDTGIAYGFLITDSTITSDAPGQSFSLGRPWQPSGLATAIAQVVIRNTELPAAIKSAPWTDMTTSFSWRNARFAEYQNSGPGAGVNADRPQLTDAEAEKYTKFAYLAGKDGWNPTGQQAPVETVAPAAPTGLAGTAGDGRATLTWAVNSEDDLAGYNVYRTAASAERTKVNSTPLTAVELADSGLTNGVTYTYEVTAVDRAGNESAPSASVTVAPAAAPLPEHDLLVASDGSGDYTSVQAAVTAAEAGPAGTAANPVVIVIKAGTYKELVKVTKPYIQLVGATGSAKDVVLTYDNAAGTPNPAGGTYGTGNSQSVLISGSNVTVRDLTIENSFDEAAFTYSAEQAVALKTTGDRLVFENVRLLGNQDTLLVDSPDAPVVARSYFVDSYIEGDVDFIFGRGTAVFDRSTINALSRGSSSNNGYVTAASTSDKNQYGFLITDSTITSNAPAGTFSLGRPWRGWSDGYTKNGTVYNSRGQVTIRNTALPSAIRAGQPWADMSPNVWTDGRFFEYGNTGAGATANANRPQLADDAATGYTKWAYLAGSDGWNPTGEAAPKPVDTTAPSAPSALGAVAANGKATLSWTAPGEQDVVGYNVYRADAGGEYGSAPLNRGTPVQGTSYTDSTVANGSTYRYVVTAVDDSGNESVRSAVASAAPVEGDSIAPAAPTGTSAVVGKGSLTVAWTAVADADVASYTVYRATGSGSPATVGTVPAGTTSFADTGVTIGTAYRYTVTAVDASGNESAASSVATATAMKVDVVVAADGSGDATTVQDGINKLADNADYEAQGGRVILIRPGTYTGLVASGNRYGVTLVGGGASPTDTVITGGTSAAATVTLSARAWTLRNLTVSNTTGPAGAVAMALQIKSGDRMLFDNVRFLGDKQVLNLSTANVTTYSRSYFRNSYIEGGADAILGRGVAVFDSSTIRILNRAGASMTDSSIAPEHPYGFLIVNSEIVTDGPANSVYLGRPYGTTGKAQVVVRNTILGAGVNTRSPWKDWDAATPWTAGRFFEYGNTGPGAAVVDPATRPQLSESDAANYTVRSYLGDWTPAL